MLPCCSLGFAWNVSILKWIVVRSFPYLSCVSSRNMQNSRWAGFGTSALSSIFGLRLFDCCLLACSFDCCLAVAWVWLEMVNILKCIVWRYVSLFIVRVFVQYAEFQMSRFLVQVEAPKWTRSWYRLCECSSFACLFCALNLITFHC